MSDALDRRNDLKLLRATISSRLSQQKLWIDFGDGEIDGFGDLTADL